MSTPFRIALAIAAAAAVSVAVVVFVAFVVGVVVAVGFADTAAVLFVLPFEDAVAGPCLALFYLDNYDMLKIVPEI